MARGAGTSLATVNFQHHLDEGEGAETEVHSSVPARAAPSLPRCVQGKGCRCGCPRACSLHSAFLGTLPILVRMFRSRKKAAVLAAQTSSATQKAVPQL